MPMHDRPGPSRPAAAAPHGGAEPDAAVGMAGVVCPDPVKFVHDLEPLLARRDIPGLIRLLDTRYSQPQMCALLAHPDADARKVAALALALVGRPDSIPDLVTHLRDPDRMVNEMAEHALWSIWFRGGTPEANARLCHGSQALNDRQVDRAAEHFTAAIALCPVFAEAYNQRAMVYYLQERIDESLHDCRKAAQLMPCHFGAWAGMGHSHAHRGEFDAALSCYRRAVAIIPHLDCVAEMVRELENRDADPDVEEWTDDWQPRRAYRDCDDEDAGA